MYLITRSNKVTDNSYIWYHQCRHPNSLYIFIYISIR